MEYMAQKVRKAVLPAAGYGTRFLPQTKAMPKQMLPIVDKPIIQYVVEDLVKSGITDIIIVTNYHERAIEDHFDRPHQDLVENILLGGEKKRPLLEVLTEISDMANFAYVRQKGPYGNGTPLLNVEHLVGDEPFLYCWSDEFIETNGGKSTPQQVMEVYEEFGCSVLGAIKATKDEDYKRFGFAAGAEIRPGLIDTNELIEKPGKDKAPSDLANVSTFLFTPQIFERIRTARENLKEGEELWYNDALKLMLQDGERILTKEIEGGIYRDAGTKLEYIKTMVDMARRHPEIGKEFGEWLKKASI
ncbi:MAG: Nucleotidyl transferase [Candidatus Amesbacteria bacterium GW2011_GWC1_47_15]|uniref:UTP--glucose-1-phosphate uridylyltransferase n=3 Tax=Candidatus Amesiibacteriota TaxID=1752730 RepID=A0A0G1S3H5_9BACT|nr:MAG: Nucleotidyl transferase [Candidatus Amesbacteria bacterium GW2011_GWC1_47_15]KKU97848.1 MAG: Nucleotidyl transferase [Candidatus Amesbacteria bacterium GW2011_GWB1_48_13]